MQRAALAGFSLSSPAPKPLSQSCAEVNLNQLAMDWRKRVPGLFVEGKNGLLVPENCQKMVDNFHNQRGIIWSHGGYLEDRSVLWAGSYMEKDNRFIHAGLDINLPAKTPVLTTFPGKVLRIDDDYPAEHGWGKRVIVEPHTESGKDSVIIFAHLDEISCKVGQLLGAGDQIAVVGTWPKNGNWYQHLHIQAVLKGYYFELLKDNLKDLDGFFPASQMVRFRGLFPDPRLIVWD